MNESRNTSPRCFVRIDRRHSPIFSSESHPSNSTTVSTFQLQENATVQNLKEAIISSGQSKFTNSASFEIVTSPQGTILTDDSSLVSFYSTHSQKRYLHCIIAPSPTLPIFGLECMSCSPIDIISPGNNVTLDTLIIYARIHDQNLSQSLAQLPTSELSGLLEIHGANDNVLEATVSIRKNKIVCTLDRHLEPGSKYMIILHGKRLSTIQLPPCCSKHTAEEHDLENQYVSFTTQPLNSCRVQIQPGNSLITLFRSSNLLQELKTRILSLNNTDVTLPKELVCLGTHGQDTWLISNNADVARLCDGDCIKWRNMNDAEMLLLNQQKDKDLLHVQKINQQDQNNQLNATERHRRYCKDNWVNEESGYYAVYGKMSPEEENDLILGIVQAFCIKEEEKEEEEKEKEKEEEKRKEEVSATMVPSISSTASTASMLSKTQPIVPELPTILLPLPPPPSPVSSPPSIPSMQIDVDDGTAEYIIPSLILNSPHVPIPLSELYQAASGDIDVAKHLLKRWNSHSYVLVDVTDTEIHNTLKRLAAVESAYFLQQEDIKRRARLPNIAYYGYESRPIYNKELFQIRRVTNRLIEKVNQNKQWSKKEQHVIQDGYDCLEKFAHAWVKVAFLASGKTSEECDKVLELQKPPKQGMSLSNLTLFKYHHNKKETTETKEQNKKTSSTTKTGQSQCPYHTDVGLLTVIPQTPFTRLDGNNSPVCGGLHIFDWSLSSWVDVEMNVEPQKMCIAMMGGEILKTILGIEPGLHEVSAPNDLNLNLVRHSSPFQCLPRSDCIINTKDGPKTGQQLVNDISMSRQSSNFPTDVVMARRAKK